MGKTFSLDQTVDVDKFTASLKNGVLTVAAPKDLEKLEENVRRIPVLAAVDAPASEEGETAAIASGNDDSQKAEHRRRKKPKPRNQWISTKRKLPIMLPKMEKSKLL